MNYGNEYNPLGPSIDDLRKTFITGNTCEMFDKHGALLHSYQLKLF